MTKEEMALVRKEVNDNIRANYGELAKFLSDGIFQLLNCVISFGKFKNELIVLFQLLLHNAML